MTTVKFGFSQLAEDIYDWTLDSSQDWTIGDSQWDYGWNAGFDYAPEGYEGLTKDDGGLFTGPAIVSVNSQGLVFVHDFDGNTESYEELREKLENEFDKWLDEY